MAARSSKSSASSNRSAAAKRTASRPGSVAEGSPDAVTRPGDAETHAAHPEQPGDSSVAHAPASGTQSAEGGYPAGEYDVTPPPSAPAVSKSEQKQAALTAHIDAATNLDAVLQSAKDAKRLTAPEFTKALEALPIGTIIEHEAPNRWRTRVVGQNRYGHGATFTEAVESYVLGDAVGSAEDAAARALLALPASQQQEIQDRDAKAAARVGGTDPLAFSREEARKAAEADKNAAPADPGATDGPQKASARAEASGK